jgi:hypothetical protein
MSWFLDRFFPDIDDGSLFSTRGKVVIAACLVAVLVCTAGLFVVGWSYVSHGPGTVFVRNESSENVSIQLVWIAAKSCPIDPMVNCHYGERRGRYEPPPLKGILVIPPWQPGECAAAQVLDAPPIGVAFVDVATLAIGAETDFPAGAPYYVRIDSEGSIHVGEPIPSMPDNCPWYQLVSQE